jgi:hypothetical protein
VNTTTTLPAVAGDNLTPLGTLTRLRVLLALADEHAETTTAACFVSHAAEADRLAVVLTATPPTEAQGEPS